MVISSAKEESSKKKKTKTGIELLSELKSGYVYTLIAQYGSVELETPMYVMEVVIGQKKYQGIGTSKKKAKTMAAENVLIALNKLKNLSELPPDNNSEPYCWEDYTADLIDKNSSLYFDFGDIKKTPEEDMSVDDWLDILCKEYGDENQHLVGKNTLSILSELFPDTTYTLCNAVMDKNNIQFVMAVYIEGKQYKGSGGNKKVAKARAARNALKDIYNMEFGVSEDGMPVYEGDERIWQMYKKKLEEQAFTSGTAAAAKNPVQQLYEFYPDVKFLFPYESNNDTVFVAQVKIDGEIFEGTASNKKSAKANAAIAVLDAMRLSGEFDRRQKELDERKAERDKKKKSDKEKVFKENDFIGKNAISKLNDHRSSLDYKVLSQTPLKNTCFTAFTVTIQVDGKDYVGVGKSKKTAKLEVAEKALRDLGYWTAEDDLSKEKSLNEASNDDTFGESLNEPVNLMDLVQQNMSQYDIMNMVKKQLGFVDKSNNRGTNSGKQKQFDREENNLDSMLTELNMLVGDILGNRNHNMFNNRQQGSNFNNKNNFNASNNNYGRRNFNNNFSNRFEVGLGLKGGEVKHKIWNNVREKPYSRRPFENNVQQNLLSKNLLQEMQSDNYSKNMDHYNHINIKKPVSILPLRKSGFMKNDINFSNSNNSSENNFSSNANKFNSVTNSRSGLAQSRINQPKEIKNQWNAIVNQGNESQWNIATNKNLNQGNSWNSSIKQGTQYSSKSITHGGGAQWNSTGSVTQVGGQWNLSSSANQTESPWNLDSGNQSVKPWNSSIPTNQGSNKWNAPTSVNQGANQYNPPTTVNQGVNQWNSSSSINKSGSQWNSSGSVNQGGSQWNSPTIANQSSNQWNSSSSNKWNSSDVVNQGESQWNTGSEILTSGEWIPLDNQPSSNHKSNGMSVIQWNQSTNYPNTATNYSNSDNVASNYMDVSATYNKQAVNDIPEAYLANVEAPSYGQYGSYGQQPNVNSYPSGFQYNQY